MTITLGEDEYASGESVTWASGENELVITVTVGEESTVYTVTVTAE